MLQVKEQLKKQLGKQLKNKVKNNKHKFKKKVILFPELDERILKATFDLKKEKIIEPVIVTFDRKSLFNKLQIKKLLSNKSTNKNYIVKNIIISEEKELVDKYSKKLYNLRKKKGLTFLEAKKLIMEPIYFATMMLYENEADGLVSGANHPTAHTLRPALQIIKTKKKNSIASSTFLMLKKNKEPLFFSDCGMNIKPSSKELLQIAVSTAETAKFFGIKPKLAFLSFSTKGSAKHEEVDRVLKAVKLAKKSLKIPFDGELQFDAAFVSQVAKLKAPKSKVAGKTNIFIFPDLNSGNIGYKIAQRLGGYKALGPIVQGLKKPVNDLSRGCTIEEIKELAYITALQSI